MAAFTFVCPYIAANAIKYFVDNQICQVPINGIVFIDLKLTRYVREMNKRVTLVNILLRAKKELKIVFRIVILISIFLILGIPYTIFVFMGYFTSPPTYHFRIAVTFIEMRVARAEEDFQNGVT
ncbi:unnamed protein product [Adineta steineri]|uniref:G-protein coupled receptors family 1 profile domain-containing protein n=2 Tax=Adineta steineri TaxID=433720 RepID=A0A818VHK0_9BILA|nr:unnamed protein product [Adineta steineri]